MSPPITTTSHSAGGIVINPTGQIVVVQTDGVFWTFPKGHLNDGETPRAAALREIWEETGLTNLIFIKELGTYTRSKLRSDLTEEPGSFKTITMYLFTTSEIALQPQDPDITTAKWLSPAQVATQLTHPLDREFYLQIQNDLRGL